MGVTTVASIAISAIALGAVVALSVAIVLLLTLAFELARDSRSLAGALGEATQREDMAAAERNVIEARAREADAAEHRAHTLRQQLEQLQERLASPATSLEGLSLMVRRARAEAAAALQRAERSAGLERWLVLQMRLVETGEVEVIARGDEVTGATALALAGPDGRVVTQVAAVESDAGEIHGTFLLAALPAELAAEIEAYGVASPSDYTLVPPPITEIFAGVTISELNRLEAAFGDLDAALADAIEHRARMVEGETQ